MSENKIFDLIIKNVQVIKPKENGVNHCDIGIKDGVFKRLAANLDPNDAHEVYDGGNKLAFPGLVDAHMHTGIYNPLDEDAIIESRAAAMGGVTSSLNYMRTGGYYLNKGGSYTDFLPDVFKLSEGNSGHHYALKHPFNYPNTVVENFLTPR